MEVGARYSVLACSGWAWEFGGIAANTASPPAAHQSRLPAAMKSSPSAALSRPPAVAHSSPPAAPTSSPLAAAHFSPWPESRAGSSPWSESSHVPWSIVHRNNIYQSCLSCLVCWGSSKAGCWPGTGPALEPSHPHVSCPQGPPERPRHWMLFGRGGVMSCFCFLLPWVLSVFPYLVMFLFLLFINYPWLLLTCFCSPWLFYKPCVFLSSLVLS